MDGLINWVDLVFLILNIVAVVWGSIRLAYLFVMNAIWNGDQNVQKGRIEDVKKTFIYMVASLVVINVVFAALTQFNIFGIGEESTSKVSDYLQQGQEKLDSGDYRWAVGWDDSSDYGNWIWEAINLK